MPKRRYAPLTRYQRHQRRKLLLIVIPILILLIVAALVATLILSPLRIGMKSSITPTTSQSPVPQKIHFAPITAPDGEPIGISDGISIFDTARVNNDLKQQAAAKLKAGDSKSAQKLWADAAALDTSDAEALIYQENQHILASRHRYISIVVNTVLTGQFASSGRDTLQGAYIAQKEYNNGCLNLPHCLPARLLIANSGSGKTASDEVAYASLVAEQIVQARQIDETIIGVMGGTISADLVYGDATFAAAHIPVISPTALLNAASSPPYIFSIAPSNGRQGTIGAYYAERTLHATHAAVFVDPVDRYSQTLADAFSQQFTADNNTIVATETYKVGVPTSIEANLPDALNNNPNVIYFAGHSTDIGALLMGLPTCQLKSCLQVLGGDALYELGGYPANIHSLLPRLHFTSFAYPDEWNLLAPSTQKPDFFSEYPAAFNPNGDNHNDSPYGFTRADSNVILSYDATITLLRSASTTFTDQEPEFSTADLQKVLMQITGTQGRQGVSGEISFGADGNPLGKIVDVLYFDENNRIHEDQCFGTFLKLGADNSSQLHCA